MVRFVECPGPTAGPENGIDNMSEETVIERLCTLRDLESRKGRRLVEVFLDESDAEAAKPHLSAPDTDQRAIGDFPGTILLVPVYIEGQVSYGGQDNTNDWGIGSNYGIKYRYAKAPFDAGGQPIASLSPVTPEGLSLSRTIREDEVPLLFDKLCDAFPEFQYRHWIPAWGLSSSADFEDLHSRYRCSYPPSFVLYETRYADRLPMVDVTVKWAKKDLSRFVSLSSVIEFSHALGIGDKLLPFACERIWDGTSLGGGWFYCFDCRRAVPGEEPPVVFVDSKYPEDETPLLWEGGFLQWFADLLERRREGNIDSGRLDPSTWLLFNPFRLDMDHRRGLLGSRPARAIEEVFWQDGFTRDYAADPA